MLCSKVLKICSRTNKDQEKELFPSLWEFYPLSYSYLENYGALQMSAVRANSLHNVETYILSSENNCFRVSGH